MIILGEKYILTEMEKSHLKKIFSNIRCIEYKNEEVEKVIEKIEKAFSEEEPRVVVLNTKAPAPDRLITYLTDLELKGVSFLSIEHFLEKYLHKCFIPDDNTDLTYLENIKPYTFGQSLQKRIIDIAGVSMLALFFWPIMLYAIYRIRKESPEGEVFFRQKRVGRGGKEFECIKFRSMIPDAEKGVPKFASKDDPRTFKWGQTMRKMRIDELPQIWNVLKGEMHLIGPRPERKYWTEQFEKIIPYYNERHLVKPGITGWAQVMYPYGMHHEDAKQKLMYDLYYIKYWSLWLEMKTVWKTILIVIGKKGM